MRKLFQMRFIPIVVLVLLLSAGAAPTVSSAPPPRPDLPIGPPLRANILLLLPAEFEGFVYAHRRAGGEVHLRLGRQATDQMGTVLRGSFASVGFMPVRSESEAMDLISTNAPDVRRYDFIAVPEFKRVDYWAGPFHYGYDISVSLAIYSPDSTKVETIGGHGESKTGFGAPSSPQESASLALAFAVDAVKDGLAMRRGSLAMSLR